MSLIVLDASAVAAWALPSQHTASAETLLRDSDRHRFLVPQIFPIEVRSLLLAAERPDRLWAVLGGILNGVLLCLPQSRRTLTARTSSDLVVSGARYALFAFFIWSTLHYAPTSSILLILLFISAYLFTIVVYVKMGTINSHVTSLWNPSITIRVEDIQLSVMENSI